MNKKAERFIVFSFIFLSVIATSFMYGKYAHTFRKTISLNISKPQYTVVFHSNNGSNNTRTQSFTYGTSQALYANTFTKTGEYFAGWNSEANGSGVSYTDKQVVTNLSSVNNDTIDLYAQWALGKAYVNGTYYPTLKSAVESVATDDVLTVVTLLADTSEIINVVHGQNIEFDFQDHTLTNSGVSAIIENHGKVKITNGTLRSNTTQGAINVYSDGELLMTGGSVIAEGTKQAVYVNGGKAEIGGTAYLSSVAGDRAPVHCLSSGSLTITGGTIVGKGYFAVKVENSCALVVGTKDGTSYRDSPVIQGIVNGIYNSSSTKIKYYDGITKGTTKAISNESKIEEIETSYVEKRGNEIIDDVSYQTYYLYKALVINFEAPGGTLSTNSVNVEQGAEIGYMPVPKKSNYIFEGWYTADDELVTEDSIANEDTTLYAHWISRNSIWVAEYNNVQYHSMQEAVNAVPSNNTPATITLLMDSREHVTIAQGKNIVLDSQGFTLKNDGNQMLFDVNGTLTINDGDIFSNENYAVIDVNPSGHVNITGGSIVAKGTRQAIYNNGGVVEISGNAYLSSCASGKPTNSTMERSTIQNLGNATLIITGGTIIGENNQAISNEGTLTIGVKDGFINTNSPVIIGITYGVKSNSTFNFYDGILKGKTDPYSVTDTITDIEVDSSIVTGTEIIDASEYKTAYLEISI